MAEDLVPVLARFHRDVLLPDVRRVVAEAVEASERRLRDEMQTGFDSVARELADLRQLYHMVDGGLKRIEERLDRMEQRMALRSEVEELKAKIATLQQKVAELEARL